MRFLLLVSAICALCAPASATVIIYKGTLTRKAKPFTTLPPKFTTYLLYEPEMRRIARVLVYQQNGEKIVKPEAPQVMRFHEVDVAQGKVATVLSFGLFINTDAENYVDALLYYRGTNATLTIRTSGQTQNHPRIFSATTLVAQTDEGDGEYAEERATYVFSEGRTKTANDANQTLPAAIAALVTALGG